MVVVVGGMETVPGSVPGTMPETIGVNPVPVVFPAPVPVLGVTPCPSSSAPDGVSVTSLPIDR